jgi:mono/diheme cytochrome c family protein
MILNILSWLLLVGLVVCFVWLAVRAWKARRWFIRWPALVLCALLALVLALLSVFSAIGLVKIYRTSGNTPPNLSILATPQMLQRGEHIAAVFCSACHTSPDQPALAGGNDLSGDIPMPIGALVSYNITPGGPIKDWSDGEIFRALRENVDAKGQRLMFMSFTNIRYMSDEDLQAVIAYLRSLPPVPSSGVAQGDRLNLLGILLFGSGLTPDPLPVNGVVSAPPKSASIEYGQYILSYQDCRNCHGADLNGGKNKFSPNGPPLRVVKAWSLDQFIATMRSGVTPDGHQLKAPMPYKAIGLMDDEELNAMFKYLTSLW